MRVVAILAAVMFGGLACLAGWVFIAEQMEHAKARAFGEKAAAKDIAAGRPFIRRNRSFTASPLTNKGLGIDTGTGLPLRNASSWCGTCSRYARPRNEAYNDRIRAAFAEGKLARFDLRPKLGEPRVLRARFEQDQPRRLHANGSPLALGEHGHLHCVQEESGWESLRWERDGEYHPLPLQLPSQYERYPARAKAPYEAVVDGLGATVYLRDSEKNLWTVDLERGVVVQFVAAGGDA